MRASRAVAPPLPRVAPPYREESAPLGEGRARSAPAWGVGGRRWPPDREAGRNRSGTAPALRAEGWRGGSTRPSDQARASPNPACDAGVGARVAVSPAAELQGGFPREPDPPTRVSDLESPGAARRSRTVLETGHACAPTGVQAGGLCSSRSRYSRGRAERGRSLLGRPQKRGELV